MKLCVAGMKHCGSTMVMNMLRLASIYQGIEINNIIVDDHFCSALSEESANNIVLNIPSPNVSVIPHEKKNIICKTHKFLQDIEDQNFFIILPLRDIRDCAISHFMRFHKHTYCQHLAQDDERRLVTMAGLSLFIVQMLENIRLFKSWYENNKCKHYVFCYEKYKENPHVTLHLFLSLFLFLQMKNSSKKLSKKRKCIDIEMIYQRTWMHT
jgi:hypothetical protein